MNARTLNRFAARLEVDPELVAEMRTNPAEVLRKEAIKVARIEDALTSDKWVYRIVVLTLGGSLLSTTIGAIVLAARDPNADLPQILVAIVSGCIGALAGLLAPSPAKTEPPDT